MLWQYILKVAISAIVVVAVSELGKRSSFWGAALASLPLTSLLAFVWMRFDGTDTQRIATLSMGIFWLVLPSLLLFLVFPALLRAGVTFWLGLLVSCAVTAGAYALMVLVLERFGVRL